MDEIDNRRQIVREELEKLRNLKLITEAEYKKVNFVHERYTEKLKEKPIAAVIQPALKQKAPAQQTNAIQHTPDEGKRGEIQSPLPQKKKAPPRKVVNPQDIRERNITWVLILGVIFILLSGLILATSNWSILSNTLKTGLITLISILFFGISVFSEKQLKIRKTALAFWILGGLFFPVAILSAGYFQLFGSWLSIFGEGKYLLGAIGATLCIPLYTYSAIKYKSRIFSWLSLATLSIDISFLLASLHISRDGYYLGIVVYNTLLLLAYSKIKNNKNGEFFIKEIPIFTQINLSVSTVFLIIFFNNPVFYGINLVLVSTLYMLMVLIYNKNGYSYIFSIILICGVYQIVENTGLQSMDLIIFSLMGSLFIAMGNHLNMSDSLRKIFRYISTAVTIIAFFYILIHDLNFLKGLFRTNRTSVLMFSAYLIIAANYMYLAYLTKKKFLGYLVPIFVFFSVNQLYSLVRRIHSPYPYSIHLLIVSLFMFIVMYYFNKWKYTELARGGSGIVALILIPVASLIAIFENRWVIASIAMLIYGAMLYIVSITVKQNPFKILIRVIIPFTWFMGLIEVYGKINQYVSAHQITWYGIKLHFGAVVLIIFGLSILARWLRKDMEKYLLYFSHLMLPLAILILYGEYKDNSLLFIIAGCIYLYSVSISKYEWEIRFHLYAALLMGTFTLYSLGLLLKVKDIYHVYVMLISSILVGGLWLVLKGVWKSRILHYLIVFSLAGIIIINNNKVFGITEFLVTIIYTALILYLLHKSSLDKLGFVPLAALYFSIIKFNVKFENVRPEVVLISVGFFIIAKIIGEYLYDNLYRYKKDDKNHWSVKIDWYSLFALFMVESARGVEVYGSPLWVLLMPGLMLTVWMFSQVKRVDGIVSRWISTAAYPCILYPYYTITSNIKIPQIIIRELNHLPLLLMVWLVYKFVWNDKEKVMRKIEMVLLIFIALTLFVDIIFYDRVADVIIFGILSLISLIAGIQYKIKSYFIVGSTALILNMGFETRNFWGNLPWWTYLLIAGIILIGYASSKEMQKGDKNKKSIKINKEVIKKTFKDWK